MESINKKIAIIGTGYIGLVTGVCLADIGNQVTCIDIDESKISKLKNGVSPIFEPGLTELLNKNKDNLNYTTSYDEGLKDADIVFIGVNTPSQPNGDANLKYIFAAAKSIGQTMKKDLIIVNKSTVPVGTGEKIEKIIKKETSFNVSVISCPEFLREGSAIYDFMNPHRIVIGASDNHENAITLLKNVFNPLIKNSNSEYVVTDLKSAEMIKYASNSFLATQISYMNELSKLCGKIGVDVTEVSRGMKLDPRIGKEAFLSAGLGYGGSCFPKDVKALIALGKKRKSRLNILEYVEKVNDLQVEQSFSKIKKLLRLKNVPLSQSSIGILGISFKPNTDDTRESQSIKLVEYLIKKGAKNIKIYDPIVEWPNYLANEKINNITGDDPNENIINVAKGTDILILATEWDEFLTLNFEKISKNMNHKAFVDLRNVYSKSKIENLGFIVENMSKK